MYVVEKKVCVCGGRRGGEQGKVCVFQKNNSVNESANHVVRVGGPKRRGEKVNGQ